jgi:hypothetical protein
MQSPTSDSSVVILEEKIRKGEEKKRGNHERKGKKEES